jgi:hypothetical protein
MALSYNGREKLLEELVVDGKIILKLMYKKDDFSL